MKEEERKNKYSINQLVEIGDMIHETELSIIIATKKIKQEKGEQALISIIGDREKLIRMLFEVMMNDKDLFSILSESVQITYLAKLQDI